MNTPSFESLMFCTSYCVFSTPSNVMNCRMSLKPQSFGVVLAGVKQEAAIAAHDETAGVWPVGRKGDADRAVREPGIGCKERLAVGPGWR
ncbi:MAG: hypothetical protein U0Q11_27220 [Vicinamibacterales bacterium]